MIRCMLMPLLVTLALITCSCSTFKSVKIESTPAGAEIWVNDVARGYTTPATLAFDLNKKHVITLKKKNYQPATSTLQFRLKSAGDVGEEIVASTCLSVCCFGIPLVIQAFEMCTYKYYWAAIPGRIHPALSPHPYTVTISTSIPGCEVFADGVLMGSTSGTPDAAGHYNLQMTMTQAGSVNVTVSKQGYVSWDRYLKLTPDNNPTLFVELTTEPTVSP